MDISAEAAGALARSPELIGYLLRPAVCAYRLRIPPVVEPGVEGAARLWLFGVIPAWRHHIRLVRLEPTEIYSNEWGGPVRTWNHRLTFTRLGPDRCRYTDEIEIDSGLRGLPVRVFAHLLFRHRYRRWHSLIRMFTEADVSVVAPH